MLWDEGEGRPPTIAALVVAEIAQADNGLWVVRGTTEFQAMFRTLRTERQTTTSVVDLTGPTLCALLP